LPPSADKEIITLLKATTEILRDQLQVKDDQIKSLNNKIDSLIERDRETNILLKGMQDKILRLERPQDRSDSIKQDINRVPAYTQSDVSTAETEENIVGGNPQNRADREEKNGKPDSKQKTQPCKTKQRFLGRFVSIKAPLTTLMYSQVSYKRRTRRFLAGQGTRKNCNHYAVSDAARAECGA